MADKQTVLAVESFNRGAKQLQFVFSYEDFKFSTTYWYDASVNFYELEKKFGEEFMNRVYFHIVAFESNKIASLHPNFISWGPFERFHTQKFEELWREVFKNVWAQWRFENDKPYYYGPKFTSSPIAESSSTERVTLEPSEIEILNFSSGGKDSLVSLGLLQNGGVPFDTLTYSSSIYGQAKPQHDFATNVLNTSNPTNRRQQWVFDDFLDSPILELHPELDVKTLTAAETPSSIFGSLPFILQHNYHYIALGHERSANTGQVFWEKTGEDVNHQWGKSFEAEKLLNSYMHGELVANFSYFSLLQPIYDVVIFSLLNNSLEGMKNTNSCNISTPWCEQCPKCIYVALGYHAYVPTEVPASIFKTNMFDNDDNQYTYRQLLGLESRLPFECIGQKEEVRLAFALCCAKQLKGKALTMFQEEKIDVDRKMVLDQYLKVYDDHGMPEHIATKVLPQMTEAAERAKKLISEGLGWK